MGAKIPLDDVIFETGGGATNAAVTFSRFGLKTTCVCSIGLDPNGKDILNVLKNEKVDTRGVQILPDLKTAYSVILLAGTGQRSILVYRGAAAQLDPAETVWSRVKSRWLYLTSLGGDLKKNRAVITTLKKQGSKVAWNPGNGELTNGLNLLSPLLKLTDILILNREEAAILAKESTNNLPAIVKRLGNLPKIALVITDGKSGAYVLEKATRHLLYSPALPGKRINTTGAGDSFGSAFVSAYHKTKSCKDGLRAGLLNSLGVITHMGAKAGILKSFPRRNTLDKIKIRNLSSKITNGHPELVSGSQHSKLREMLKRVQHDEGVRHD
ncbi:MAG: carbohydrate kinase family protein [Patescibacteria group bacterium]